MSMSVLWNSYLNQVVPKNACSVQVDETKKAFYAGGIAVTALIRKMTQEDSSKAVDLFEALEDELMTLPLSMGPSNVTN